MTLLSSFLDVLFRALIFVGLALSVGGVVFRLAVLRGAREHSAAEASIRRAAELIASGALLVAVCQLSSLVVTSLALGAGAPSRFFLSTEFARVSLMRAALAVCLAGGGLSMRRWPRSRAALGVAAVAALLVLIDGAWLTHGASRLHSAAELMTITILHQFAGLAWIGGTIHLAYQWRLLRTERTWQEHWPSVVSRFSNVALSAVGVLVAAGLYLYWAYIRSPEGLIGTSYGVMLLSKISLMGAVLLLGGLNNRAVQRWRRTPGDDGMTRHVPAFVGVEAVVGITILMAAAALTSQTPAIDQPSRWARPAEVAEAFAPKVPRLVPPPHYEVQLRAASSLDIYALPTRVQKLQSDFNHNTAGVFVVLAGLLALFHRLTRARWARGWPLAFVPLAIFLVLFGEPTGWPLGKEGFWNTLISPEVLQHRLSTLLVVLLGYFQWRVELHPYRENKWRYVFPVMLIIGGVLLLTHSHSIFAVKWAFLVEATHNAIGVLAIFMGASAWLELTQEGRAKRVAGLIWPTCFVLVGLVLLFYREI